MKKRNIHALQAGDDAEDLSQECPPERALVILNIAHGEIEIAVVDDHVPPEIKNRFRHESFRSPLIVCDDSAFVFPRVVINRSRLRDEHHEIHPGRNEDREDHQPQGTEERREQGAVDQDDLNRRPAVSDIEENKNGEDRQPDETRPEDPKQASPPSVIVRQPTDEGDHEGQREDPLKCDQEILRGRAVGVENAPGDVVAGKEDEEREQGQGKDKQRRFERSVPLRVPAARRNVLDFSAEHRAQDVRVHAEEGQGRRNGDERGIESPLEDLEEKRPVWINEDGIDEMDEKKSDDEEDMKIKIVSEKTLFDEPGR
ncbi:MAG TPA: hypothetical protein PKI53_09825 [Candidatus Aminicenantes bacterium]|nr:hypothetical protein [Candidatus Aminicenantes bacterium]HPH44405.1 hypothetical protein [Candidatus Aminicenantes bacterium]